MLDFRGVTENCLALVIFSAAGLILDLLQRGTAGFKLACRIVARILANSGEIAI